MPKTPFVAPQGTRLVRVDRRGGKRVYGEWPSEDPMSAVIWEAFKAETEPKRTIRRADIAARDKPKNKVAAKTRSGAISSGGATPGPSAGTKRDQDFIQQGGGIY